MRVLLVPEVYRPGDATACGTVRDAVTWVRQWLDLDPTLHVYWLLPPRDQASYDREFVLADRERVTLIEAETLGPPDARDMLTDNGYTTEQLVALEREIFDVGGYVDVVVDQLRGGRYLLYKWLLDQDDHWSAQVRPFDVVANVHDLQLPFKYRFSRYRNDYQMYHEMCSATFTEGRWFTAGVDRTAYDEQAREFLAGDVVDRALSDAVTIGSPIDLDRFEERYADEPRVLHVAGSLWEKKQVDRVLAVAESLHDRFGIQTVLTSMDDVPPEYRDPDWITAYPHASRETYEQVLAEADIAVTASEYETLARTPFEQAASGQVLLLRDRPWIYDCVPEDHPLVAPLEDLDELAGWAVEHWEEAVAANRDLVGFLREERSPAAVGQRTYRDLRRRVDEKLAAFAPQPSVRRTVERTLAEFDGPVPVDELDARTAAHTDDGRPLLAHTDSTPTDLRYTLRSLGYVDTGASGTPVFAPAEGGAADGLVTGETPMRREGN